VLLKARNPRASFGKSEKRVDTPNLRADTSSDDQDALYRRTAPRDTLVERRRATLEVYLVENFIDRHEIRGYACEYVGS
jgi:hypothetical protein